MLALRTEETEDTKVLAGCTFFLDCTYNGAHKHDRKHVLECAHMPDAPPLRTHQQKWSPLTHLYAYPSTPDGHEGALLERDKLAL
jgi:hypothetical protein